MTITEAARETASEADHRAMLLEMVRRLLADRAHEADDEGALWSEFHRLGLTGLGHGDGDDLPEILIVMEELGRAACPAPLLATIVANLALGKDAPTADGEALAVAFAGYDGDRAAGWAEAGDGRIDGELRFVEGMTLARQLVVFAGGPAVAVIACDGPSVEITPTSGLFRAATADVMLKGAPARVTSIDAARIADLRLIARLCRAARALGAAAAGFDLVLDHARDRRQFGQPIGQFQAIQHKLASSHIALDGARLQIKAAGAARSAGAPGWPLLARAAIAFASQTLRQVALETQHVFGAIGFAEEHIAPKLFRLVHADTTAMGGAPNARADLAALLFDGEGDAFAAIDHDEGDPANGIRNEIRAWLAANWSDADRRASRATPFRDRKWNLPFAAKLGEAGWTTLNWPSRVGGQQRAPIEQLAFVEELLRAHAPDGPLVTGTRILAPEIIGHGSRELQETLLPALRTGRASACLGYSEPEAGSDLASLRTRAEFDGRDYVVNGQKIWTTDGHRATHMILAARTNADPDARHGGISLFVLPMDTPGITVRPTMAMYGDVFCNIFLDDVRIPPSHLLGRLNGGWSILINALASERIVMGAFASQVRDLLRSLVAELKVRGMADDPVTRDRIAALAAEAQTARELSRRSILLSGGDYAPLVEAAMAKVYASELAQRLTETAIDIFGGIALLDEDARDVPADGGIDKMLRYSIMMVVGGGTNEIQRNVIAQRGLGLPPARR